MGCGPSSSDAVVTFDRSPPFYVSNEVVSGTMRLIINDDTVNIDELVLNFIGEAGYTTTQETMINGKAQVQTIQHEVPLVSVKHVLATPPAGQSELTYGKGEHVFPFQIQLPANVPPSMCEAQRFPHVRYYVQMYVDRAWYKMNTRENMYITFHPLVPLSRIPNALNPTMFGQNQHNVLVKGSLNKLGYQAGEAIQGVLDIDNSRATIIKQVDIQLIQNSNIGGKTLESIVVQTVVPEMAFRREPRINQPFSITLPAKRMTPTYQFHGGLKQAVTANNSYFLKFSIVLEGFTPNIEILVPIVIGNQP